MFMYRNYILFFYCIIFPLMLHAQFRATGSFWKQNREEASGGIGASNFLGELGGADGPGRNFLYDFKLSETSFALSAGYRYFLSRQFAVNTSLIFGRLSGNDNNTKEPFRNNRNLSFRSNILELSSVFEYHVIQETTGRMYKVRGTKGTMLPVGIYLFGGVGAFYFNPQALYKGKWVDLQPLSTEGQGIGIDPNKKPYAKFSYTIPMGIGFRTAIDQTWRVSLEVSVRKTFTDYIDDVSTTYFDNDSLRAAKGNVAAELADPNLGKFPGQLNDKTKKTNARNQRGDPKDNDSYMFVIASINYKMLRRRGYRKIKSRRSVPSF